MKSLSKHLNENNIKYESFIINLFLYKEGYLKGEPKNWELTNKSYQISKFNDKGYIVWDDKIAIIIKKIINKYKIIFDKLNTKMKYQTRDQISDYIINKLNLIDLDLMNREIENFDMIEYYENYGDR
ncbi:hypothetical protein GCL60_16325 [Silvanigrella paludirubra]|uniref:Uncharacterized protein n=1 Tax=Silvanigrella paludirubra TaxID=2499159 RepID=A0A6N6VN24_9BACT|nr:hypothetical protein [Silvanigrella paludirubra]KAB8035794.1 hypothetical protein GCL60_16325 [Silvanigrella paludirubra]